MAREAAAGQAEPGRQGVELLLVVGQEMGPAVLPPADGGPLNPQGTLAERIRAGGAGIYAFFTKTGAGTAVAEGKEQRTVDGETYVLEKGLTADVAIVKAWKGDTEGNLIYRKTARNFNPNMATAAHITVAEVEELVEPGVLDGDSIHTPGIFVRRIIQGARYAKVIEKRTVRKREERSRAVVA